MQSATGQSTNTSVFGYRKLNTTALKIGNVPKWIPDNEKQVKVSLIVMNSTITFYIIHTTSFPQYPPSAYMYEMGLSTDERTALQIREATMPKILEFLDMGQTSYQRVRSCTVMA